MTIVNSGGNERQIFECPHPFCAHRTVQTLGEIRMHYIENHKCGRCNHGKHRKCRKGLCGCILCNVLTKARVDSIMRQAAREKAKRMEPEREAAMLRQFGIVKRGT